MMNQNEILASASKSISYSIIVQLLFRLLTFILNATVIRYISKDLFGLVNVRLLLLYNTIFCLTSEPFVRAFLSKTKNEDWKGEINLLWYSLPIAIIWASVCTFIWLFWLEWPDVLPSFSYAIAVLCFSLSAVIELLSQPIHIAFQNLLMVKIKPFIDGTALAIESLIIIVLVLFYPLIGIYIFCLARIMFALTTTILYFIFIYKHINLNKSNKDFPYPQFSDLFLSSSSKKMLDNTKAKLLWSFSKQVILKELLTEGEKYVMTVTGVLSFADQGVYIIINNLGSLIVRIIFRPMEDGFYLFISKSLKRDLNIKQQEKESIKLVIESFNVLLKIRFLLGLTISIFGYPCAYLALRIVFGSNLSSPPGPHLLRWNCLYIFFVSINGITEGFQNATMNQIKIDRYNQIMLCFSLVFLFVSWLFTGYLMLGAVGFYLSNCIIMILRISYSCHYIQKYFQDCLFSPFQDIIPSLFVITTYSIVFVIMAFSEISFCYDSETLSFYHLLHIFIVLICLILVSISVWFKEKSLVTFIRKHYLKNIHLKLS